MAEPVDANTAVSIDADGRVHVAATKAIEEPESLIELRKRVTAMMPRVDISEAILEVLGWCPQFLESLTPTSGAGRTWRIWTSPWRRTRPPRR